MKEANEFQLIRRLAERLQGDLPPGVVGIGDDAAAIPFGDEVLLLTCDIAVEGRHFRHGAAEMADVGWKLASANVSDVVACGGLPEFALISLGVPDGMEPARLDALYDGFHQAAAQYGFRVVGGNVSGAGELVVDCFMVGRAPRFISRGGAEPGQLLGLSGAVGDSAAGLEALLSGQETPSVRPLIAHHLRPTARTDLVPFLRQHATAAIDISDGLAAELHHLAQASGTALAITGGDIPVSPDLVDWYGSDKTGTVKPPLAWALSSGEEYQILCALPPEARKAAQKAGVSIIGEVHAGSGVTLDGAPLEPAGWDHLRGAGP